MRLRENGQDDAVVHAQENDVSLAPLGLLEAPTRPGHAEDRGGARLDRAIVPLLLELPAVLEAVGRLRARVDVAFLVPDELSHEDPSGVLVVHPELFTPLLGPIFGPA